MTSKGALDLLEPGVLLGGALFRSLHERIAEAERLPAGTRLGPFRIVDELGRGGMGIVYRAERDDGEYRQQVAIKCVLDDYSETRAALFRRERQTLAELRHPHIARLLDGGRDAHGKLWLAMELIEGERIDAHAARLDIDARLKLFLQVIDAVAAAHARLVMHRDIKPSNVLVDADGSAKLLDFGISSLVDDADATRAYSPRWASPEQHAGALIGPASDQYQLALLLDALLRASSGDDGSQATATASVATQGAAAGIDPAAWIAIPAPRRAELAAIVRKAHAPDGADRYGSVREFGDDLQRWRERRPVSAYAGGIGYGIACALRRHPLAAGAAALVLFAAVALVTAFNWRLTKQRDVAEAERARADREAAEARAISQFLDEDLIGAANPLNRPPGTPEVTVREALDRADAVVIARFREQPETAVRVLTTLGNLHHEFGDYDRAARVLDQALALAATHVPGGVAQHRAALERGALRISNAEYTAAEAGLARLVEAMPVAADPRDGALRFEARLRLLEARGYAHPETSSEPLETLAREVEQALGAPHELAAEARYLIGDFARTRGTPLEAAAAIEAAAAEFAATLGADHPNTLEAAVGVAHLRRAQGRVAEAIDSLRATYALQIKRYGQNSTSSLWMQNEIAFLLIGAERFAEALPMLQDLIERRGAVNGIDSATLVAPMTNLANALMRLGRPAEALPVLDRADRLIAMERSEPVPAAFHLVAARTRADVLRELGRLDEGWAVLDRVAARAATMPADDVRVLALQGARARLMIARGDRQTGLALLDRTIAALRVHGEHHPTLRVLAEARGKL